MKNSLVRNRRMLTAVLIIAMLITALPFPVFAASDSQKIVRVGYFQDNDGFQSGFADNAPKSGYAYEFYQELSKYTGWKYQYVYGSWSEIYQKLVDGDIDIMGGVSKLDSRLPDMLFPDNIMGVESYYVFVPSGSDTIRAGVPGSLNGRRIGVNDNSYQYDLLRKYVAANAPDCTVIPYKGTEERMAALQKGELDGVVTVDNYTIDGLKPVFKIGSSDYYFAVNKSRPDILRELNDAQEKILSDNPYYISSLQKKYFNTSVVRESLSDDEAAWLSHNSSLRLGYLKNALPYCGCDPQTGDPTGMLAEIVPDIESFTGASLTSVGYDSFEEMSAAMKDGDVDVIFPACGDIWMAENQDYIQSRSVAGDRLAVVYSGEYKQSVFDSIAISRESAIQPLYISVKYPDAGQIECADLEECLQAVHEGRASCSLVSSNTLYRYLSENGEDTKLHIAYPDTNLDYCFAVSRENTTLYTILNKAITSVDSAKIDNAVTQNSNVEDKYSLQSFLEHNVSGVLAFLIVIFLIMIMIFAVYRKKSIATREQLQAAYEAANKAAQAKTVFLSTMSHDIRTPMNAIMNLTAMARNEIDDKEHLIADLDKIDTSNRFLLGLINDILDITRIESGELVLNKSVYPYKEFYRYIVSVIKPLCDKRKLRFELTETVPFGSIITDEIRFNQIFFNLLSNAVKFSEPGSTIALRMENVHTEGRSLSVDFVVEDHGSGMSEEFQKKLFTPFEREFGGDSRMGTGLGLAITKRIVDAMGGTLRVESVQGQGTKITVHLNLELASGEQEAEAGRSHSGLSCAMPVISLQGRHILVAEDHPLNREIISRILTSGGMDVDLAEDGARALELFRNSAAGYYDAILMDIRMPVMNGLEAAKAIRALPRPDAADVTIIATTAEAFDQEKEDVFRAGMNNHLAKPIDPAELFEMIADSISARKNRTAE